MERTVKDILQGFSGRRVAIVGDIVADQFLSGTISRVSREAPVFILRHDETVTLPGGAGNTAANVASLGGEPFLIGIIGRDAEASLLKKALSHASVSDIGIVSDPDIRTTTKVRVIAGQHYATKQQVIRIDHEHKGPIAAELRAAVLKRLRSAAAEADAMVVSDYGYGIVDQPLYSEAQRVSRERGIPLIVDSRFALRDLKGADSATPNQEEVEQLLGSGFTEHDCEHLRTELDCRALLVTRGNNGMMLIEEGKAPQVIPAVGSAVPVDVTGAGDTVIAAYSLALASGLTFLEAAVLANHAGGIVVMKKGTACVSSAELQRSMERERTGDRSMSAK